MTRRVLLLSRLSLAVPLLLLLPAGLARAQRMEDGEEALNSAFSKHRSLISRLLRGETTFDPKDKDHQEAVDVAAKYSTYRLAWRSLDRVPGEINKIYYDFDSDLYRSLLKYRPATQPLIPVYARQVMIHALEVLRAPDQQARPIAKVNAARILAGLTILGQGEEVDTLLEALKTENEGAQYWVLRGLRDLLAQPPHEEMPVVSPERRAKAAKAIVDFLARESPITPESPQDELDGYRLLRREAIRALANVHNPNGGEARPALVLLRFVANDERIVPEPRIDERLEAAIGIARMQSAKAKEYQAAYAAHQVGHLVADLATAASRDRADKKSDVPARRPWKLDAARLSDALDLMKADAKNPYVTQVIDQSQKLLAKVLEARTSDPGALKTWLSEDPATRPPVKELFKDVADSTVKPRPSQEAK